MSQFITFKNKNEIFLDDFGRLYLITRQLESKNKPFKESIQKITQKQLFSLWNKEVKK